MSSRILWPVLGLGLICACTGEDVAGDGSVLPSYRGGVVLSEGFPYTEEGLDPLVFTDGWSIQFTSFAVTVASVTLTDPETQAPSAWTGLSVLDLARPTTGVELPLIENVLAIRQNVGTTLGVASAAAENVSATQAVYDRMVAQGWTAYIEGTATSSSGRQIGIEVGFAAPTQFRSCTNGTDGTAGLVVTEGGPTSAFFYPHLVHMFWDELAGTGAALRFDPWAAVAGSDGIVTADELATQDLLDMRDAAGNRILDRTTGNPVVYDDGGLLSGSQLDLLSFVTYAFRQSVHFNGLGYCAWTAL